MPGISIHVVDVARGKPAAGMRVDVYAVAGHDRCLVGGGSVGPGGVVEHAMNAGEGVAAGTHEVLLHAGDYFRDTGLITDRPAFQEIVALRFTVLDVNEHYHLPVKLTPWGLSVWRGA